MPELSGAELTRHLSISPTTLRLWGRVLGLPVRPFRWRRQRYDEGTVRLLESVKRLRANGLDFRTIAQELAPPRQAAGAAPRLRIQRLQEIIMHHNDQQVMVDDAPRPAAPANGVQSGVRAFVEPVRTAPVELVEHLNELQDQHTKAVYLIGQLEERLKAREQQVSDLVAAANSPEQQFRELLLLQELKDAQKYIGLLEGELAALKARRLFGFLYGLFRWRRAAEPAESA